MIQILALLTFSTAASLVQATVFSYLNYHMSLLPGLPSLSLCPRQWYILYTAARETLWSIKSGYLTSNQSLPVPARPHFTHYLVPITSLISPLSSLPTHSLPGTGDFCSGQCLCLEHPTHQRLKGSLSHRLWISAQLSSFQRDLSWPPF